MKIFQTLSSLSLSLILVFWLSACSSDEATETQSLTLTFQVVAHGETMDFETQKYQTEAGQEMSFERIKIYLSQVHLMGENEQVLYTESESYHLLSFDVENSTVSFTLDGVPANVPIVAVQMGVGVDATANGSIDQVGDLDPSNGMAWDWNTGYKFLLLEGRYFPEADELGKEIKMHIGTDKNYFVQTWTLEAPRSLSQAETIHFVVDGLAPIGTVDYTQGTVFMNDDRGDEVAQNYKNTLISLK
ncbi:hypothetical protein N7E81_11385 [Reichenbachiella carrageenanivorans]|uniref:Copper-binding protein MbnP-like domain-containing protein n=1 Tax=Reichenbachiella carrageenanivorans TaxID=2979869 RepID=A0ABY6CVS5_9BACT|nr:MbnP family protein [Reichenbachiella carrageenanivorans]UXX77963.1 hypothetical protein N7E81_11385 [Reichenbachiella carrageenanivorans]